MANGITQYDSPAQSNFIQTYSPIPFEELMQAGALKQKAYETGLDNLMKTYEDTHNLKYIPGSVDEQYIKQHVIPTASKIVDKYVNQDLSDPVVRRQMRQDFNSNIDTNRIRDIQDSHAAWTQNQQWRQKLQAEGKYQSFLDDPDTGYDTSTQGVYSKMTPAFLEARPVAEEYFKDMKGSSYTDPNTGEVRVYIDPSKVNSVASGAVQSFLENVAGQQKVRQYRYQNPDSKATDEQIAHQYLTEVGKEYIYNQHQGFVPEWMMKSKEEPKSPYFKIERTPIISTEGHRQVKSKDFDLQTPTTGVGYTYSEDKPTPSSGKGYQYMNFTKPHGDKPYYDTDLLNEDEVRNIIELMPKEYKDRVNLIKDPKWVKENPDQATRIQKDIFGKLKNTYQQLEKELQQGSYLNTYYPDKIEGVKESYLNNSKLQTDYIFGTDELKKVGAGNVINREFIDPKSGKVMSGKDFYDKVISKELSNNKDASIKVTGDYHYEHPFVALSNNDNFGNAYQISVNGKQYVMSSSAADYSDKLFQHKKNANKSYTLMKFNPGIPVDENDGTLKMYNNGVYAIMDKDSREVLSQSPSFEEAYNTAAQKLSARTTK